MPHRNHKPHLIVGGIAAFGLACCVGGAVASKLIWPAAPSGSAASPERTPKASVSVPTPSTARPSEIMGVPVGPDAVVPTEAMLVEDIRKCKWWKREPSVQDVMRWAQRLVDTNSGEWVYFGRGGIDPSYRPPSINFGTIDPNWEPTFKVPVFGIRRWTIRDALAAIKLHSEQAEFEAGPPRQP